MSKKVVEIVQDGSYRAAQPMQVMIAAGGTIEFKALPGEATLLVLTPETASILSPNPGSAPIEIAGGSSVTFEFLQPTENTYCAQVLPQGTDPRPINCVGSSDGAVLTILSSDQRGGNEKTGRGI